MALQRIGKWLGVIGVVGLVWACSSKSSEESNPSADQTAGPGGSGGSGGSPSGDSSTAQSGGASSAASTVASNAASSSASTSGAGGKMPIACSVAYSDIKGDCDMLQQDCPPGQTCGPIDDGSGTITAKCTPATGLKTGSKPCTEDTECAAGLFCVFGACSPVCCPGSDQTCDGGTCNVTVMVGTKNFYSGCSYLQQCTLLTKDACPSGFDCHLQDTAQGLASCTPPTANQVDEGGACMFLNDCKDMQFCYSMKAGDPGVCRFHCKPSNAMNLAVGLGGCPPNETCTMFDLGVRDLGLCLPP